VAGRARATMTGREDRERPLREAQELVGGTASPLAGRCLGPAVRRAGTSAAIHRPGPSPREGGSGRRDPIALWKKPDQQSQRGHFVRGRFSIPPIWSSSKSGLFAPCRGASRNIFDAGFRRAGGAGPTK